MSRPTRLVTAAAVSLASIATLAASLLHSNAADQSNPLLPTLAPTTLAPTTLAPTTLAPTTLTPTTVAPTTVVDPSPRVIAWNDLGMHCIDPDFSVFAILPPANTINAQLVVNGVLQDAASYSLTYEAVADAAGSINSTSIGKTNFWSHVQDLFGVALPLDVGLTGNAMPGATPQPMSFDPAYEWFQAEFVPYTPIDDAGQKNPYPLIRIVARDAQGDEIASTVTAVPNSAELECSRCHSSGASPFARPDAGWVYEANPLRDDRLNILRLHDEQHLGEPAYTAALTTLGLNSAGLFESVVTDNKAILCDACHASNALPGTGIDGIMPMTQAIHGKHADVVFSNGIKLSEDPTRNSCYVCHPGFDTQCLRGAMGHAVGADGGFSMECQSCHGNQRDVGDPTRIGWLEQQNCQNCHTGTAVQNNGEIRYETAFEPGGQPRIPVSTTFATTPDVPAAGFSLYRFSEGHGGLQCSACHGSPHAIYPTNFANDNVQSQLVQGHVGTIVDCASCHGDLEDDELIGPHGMHPVGQDWGSDKHSDAAEQQGTAACAACHGADFRGTVLSRALGDRTIQSQFGVEQFWRGAQVGCFHCHDGPNSDNATTNQRPTVPNLSRSTLSDTPLAIGLVGTDPNNDPLSLRVVSQPTHGTVAFDGTTATYVVADVGFLGTDSFTYAAWDGKTNSNLGVVSISVTAPACSGTITEYGFGCPGTDDLLPLLHVDGCAAPGETVTLQVERGLGGAPSVLLLGFARAAIEIAPGCMLRAGPVPVAIPLPSLAGTGAGMGTLTLPIPIQASQAPATFAMQVVHLDPGATNLISMTGGVELIIR